ncbi:MAG: hypothetical protein VX834_07180 [Myxococcota bacterium]|nr:hypothetical protein [Myxococcota bacterium]
MNGNLGLTCLVGFFVASLGWSHVAHADDTHYQDFIVGGRAVGLGGAFCSIADDPSGIFYNPAGIVDSRHSSLQVSTNLYGFERGGYDEIATLPGVENLNIDFTELIIVPSSAGVIRTLGELLPNGLPGQAVGLSVVVPSFRSIAITSPRLDVGSSLSELVGEQERTYVRRVTDRSLWAGLAYARKFGPRLRLGVGAHYILRTLVDTEEASLVGSLDQGKGEVFSVASNDITLVNGNVLMTLGLKYRFDNGINVGLNLMSPTLGIHSSGTIQSYRGESFPNCPDDVDCSQDEIMQNAGNSNFQLLNGEARSETHRSFTVKGGLSYTARRRLTLSGDLTFHAPISYELVEQLGARKLTRLPFVSKINRRPVLNFNVGAEFLVVPEVSLAAGVFSDYSSADSIAASEIDEPRSPDVDLMGVTFAIGYFGEHTLTRIGVLYNQGKGRDVVQTNEVESLIGDRITANSYETVAYAQSFLYFFVSSTFRY